MKELIAFIKSLQELDYETEKAIESYFEKVVFDKNEFIIEHGKICNKIYFIESGLVRRFYDDDGSDKTTWIYTENQFFTSISSFFEQKKSLENFQACEQTIAYSLSYDNEQILLEYPLFAKFHIKHLRLYLSKLNEFHHLYKEMAAPEKYSFLINSFPQMIKKAKLKHIASMIGVSPETLSRIRAAII